MLKRNIKFQKKYFYRKKYIFFLFYNGQIRVTDTYKIIFLA